MQTKEWHSDTHESHYLAVERVISGMRDRLHKPLSLDDIEATFAQLKSNGVPIVDEPQKHPWGWLGVFVDQDGNSYTAIRSLWWNQCLDSLGRL